MVGVHVGLQRAGQAETQFLQDGEIALNRIQDRVEEYGLDAVGGIRRDTCTYRIRVRTTDERSWINVSSATRVSEFRHA
jgi:hypothetical protein